MLPNTKLTCAELVSALCMCVRVKVADYWQIKKSIKPLSGNLNHKHILPIKRWTDFESSLLFFIKIAFISSKIFLQFKITFFIFKLFIPVMAKLTPVSVI